MRGIAAIAVMFSHYLVREDFKFLHSTGIAVDFFFVLSGFVISHSYAAKLDNGMTGADYAVRRIARLFPMMALGLLVGGFALWRMSLLGITDLPVRQVVVSVLQNLLFIPSLRGGLPQDVVFSRQGLIFPADDPLWSIFFELVASLSFLWLLLVGTSALVKTGLACLALIFALAIGNTLLGHTPYVQSTMGFNTDSFIGGFPRVFYGFICGMVIFRVKDAELPLIVQGYRRFFPANPALLYTILTIALLFPLAFKGLYYFAAITLIGPVLVLQGSLAECRGRFMIAGSEFLGWLSYPLYCVHMPVFMAMLVAQARYHVFANDTVDVEVASVAITLAFACAAGFAFDRLKVQRRFGALLGKAAGVTGQ